MSSWDGEPSTPAQSGDQIMIEAVHFDWSGSTDAEIIAEVSRLEHLSPDRNACLIREMCSRFAALTACRAQVEGEKYRHVKRGTVYEVVGVAELQIAANTPSEGDGLVIYRGDDGKFWARLADEFHDGRFVAITRPGRSSHEELE